MLGVSPAAASTPTGVFNQRFEALFPRTGALGCVVYFAPPPFFPVYLCVNVEPWGATRRSACPVLRHSESGLLGLSVRECGAAGSASGQTACPVSPTLRESSPPWLPVSAPPTSLDECFFFISLVVRLPCSSVFCQFWLFFVFKLLLAFFWLCENAQCVYLHLHLGRKPWKAF